MANFDRIYSPAWSDKHDPRCPECGETMFYVGIASELSKGEVLKRKLYQCGTCCRLYQERKEVSNG